MHAPEKLHQYEGVRLHRDFQFGAEIGQGMLEPLDKERIFNVYKQKAANKNQIEQIRSQKIPLTDSFLLEARQIQEAMQ